MTVRHLWFIGNCGKCWCLCRNNCSSFSVSESFNDFLQLVAFMA